MNRITIFVLILLTPIFSQAAETIEAFSSKFINALESNNAAELESLIYPGSVAASKRKGLGKHKNKIASILKQNPPSVYHSHRVEVEDISAFKDYDPATNSIAMFGEHRAVFPIKLEKRYTIYVSDADEGGDGTWTTPLTTQVLSKQDGHWYMVWPNEINND